MSKNLDIARSYPSTHISAPTSYHIYNGSLALASTTSTSGFSTTLYTGNGGTQSVNTGVDMDTQWGNDSSEKFGGLVWIKSRSVAYTHTTQDTIRGAGYTISSNLTDAQSTGFISSFTSGGFSVNVVSGSSSNANATTYASWNFQTTHRTSGTTNHGKPYTCHYNPFTGFTIVKYEGSGIAGHEIPHHLGRKLGFVTTKNLSASYDWIANGNDKYLYLNNANASPVNYIASNEVVHYVDGSGAAINAPTNQYVLYGWANSYFDEANTLIGNYEVGIYQGTGASGNKVVTRGKPAWVMVKRLDSTGNWVINDNKRNEQSSTTNDGYLYANLSNAEGVGSAITYTSDGFIFQDTGTDTNASGGQYLYMVVYDNDNGSGKTKYPKPTDSPVLNLNATVPLAKGIDSKGSKNSIQVLNETVTGVTLTAGKNYLYKTDSGYGVSKYAPCYGTLPTRTKAGETPDWFDVNSNKWFTTNGGSELVTNGTFDSNTSGWTAKNGATVSVVNGTAQVSYSSIGEPLIEQAISTIVGKLYKVNFNVSGTYGMVLVGSGNSSTWDGSIKVSTISFAFIATSTVTYIKLLTNAGGAATSNFDNISVFEAIPTVGTEITSSRNYLDAIVYADTTGNATYVEQLPKTVYVDEIQVDGLNVLSKFNLNQTWQNVTSQRVAGATYTNTTGKPMMVVVSSVMGSGAVVTLKVDGVFVDRDYAYSNVDAKIVSIVPNGSSYVLSTGSSINTWNELR